MKSVRYNFQWFPKEDRRRSLRASVSKDGKLRLGKILRDALPRSIQVGFDSKMRVLAIADGHGAGIEWAVNGVMTAEALSAQIVSSGLCLPVSFRLSRDESTGYFLGRVIPRCRKMEGSAEREYDMEQLLVLYQHIVENAVDHLAKSTPRPERRSIVLEEFYTAAREYRSGYGNLEDYLEYRINQKLLAGNKQYTATYGQYSLGQPLSQEEGDGFRLYDVLGASGTGGIGELEDRLVIEEFCQKRLLTEEQTLIRMLRDGYLIPQIAERLGLDSQEVQELGSRIAQKWCQFCDDV